MNPPLLSIVIPAYNRADLLRPCLESLRTVSLDCEIVVVDDASPDDTPAIVAAACAADERVRYLRNETNLGLAGNFNKALASGQGRYLCQFGDDDLALPGNFERKVALLEAHPHIGLVYSRAYRIDAQGQRHDPLEWPGLTAYPYIGGRAEFYDLLPNCYISMQTVVFRRELWERFGGYDESHPDIAKGPIDWDLWLRYCYHTATAFLPEPMVGIRMHDRSFSEQVARREGKFALGRLALWRKWLLEHDPPPVLDERRWTAMYDAFDVDLDYDFADRAQIAAFRQQLDGIRREHAARLGNPPLNTESGWQRDLCRCWRCRARRFLRHRRLR